MVDKEFLKGLRRKKRQTLKMEMKDLQERQAKLRTMRDELVAERNELRSALANCVGDDDKEERELIKSQLSDIKNDITDINNEYKSNGEVIKYYSEALDGKSTCLNRFFSTLIMAGGTGAAVYLGKQSLDKAYEANTEGRLVNKGPLDFFNRLNPLKMFGNFRF